MSTNDLELEPAILTIFGITGDLARRYLLPAIYQLIHRNLLAPNFKIVGITRQALTARDIMQTFRASLAASGVTHSDQTLARIQENLHIVSMDITDRSEYARLKTELDTIEDGVGQCLHRLFFLAIPPTVYGPIVERLGEHDLNHGCRHGSTDSRVLIEKPFGYDLKSAEELIKTLNHSFHEEQIYRIDHYLAKETVQNILAFRANNPLFQAVWNNHHISRILIKSDEAIGIEGRAAFYEPLGALRDFLQNHLLRIAALLTMELPGNTSTEAIRAVRSDLMDAIRPPRPNEIATKTVRAQYDTYRQEVGNPDSQTETYAMLELTIDRPDWAGVPLILSTGKALAAKNTEVRIEFKPTKQSSATNWLTMRLQPNEGITLNLQIKRPGFAAAMEPVEMKFDYHSGPSPEHPDAYERVLVDAMRGDQTLFATSREVLASWHIVQPILDAWQNNATPLYQYPSGSQGPTAADNLLRTEAI